MKEKGDHSEIEASIYYRFRELYTKINFSMTDGT